MQKTLELMATLQDPEQQELLRDIVGLMEAPRGFDSWRSAALHEKIRRVEAERRIRELEQTVSTVTPEQLKVLATQIQVLAETVTRISTGKPVTE